MQIQELSTITDQEMNQLINVWESAVTATHHFLTNTEIQKIKQYVPQAFRGVEHLIVAMQDNQIKGLMGVNGTKLEMLFVDNNERGHGIGTKLLSLGMKKYHVNELAVNEQNPAARGFYEHMGFKVVSRSPLDDQGNPYPILKMRQI
ncbi:GNAT family N-acetyltransferase [Limosilactobacillus sp. STM2_1]|uniref:GNAT family N-acetyltransferase n=1 Tax=Limosilactobacillus rudii TaxID=2759755 RepID=A0A7W3UKP7_9LACO|nr:GNAT family N-acetyltransferase [Limosilactobacillus rudii]MBB1079209.1 GNAT family N-acetyltransferase [Limosilactobacillus rudii]MBB1097298.1 GNAT family N-acetyltransferase [Limosilactobacillus rudii]MCD7134407.1 GNAT family N-acetyltransferase [Limosilactobacillus rudii]